MTHGVEFYMGWRWIFGDMPKDITDYSVLIQIKPFCNSVETIASYDRTSPYVLVNDLDGSVTLNLPPSITSTFTFNTSSINCLLIKNDDTDGEMSPSKTIILGSC